MKKLSLFLALISVFLCSVTAQENTKIVSSDTIQNDGKNWFLGAGVQGDVYANDNLRRDTKVWTKPSLGGNLFVGKWLSHKVGLRLLGEGGSLHPFFYQKETISMGWMEKEKYLAGRVDLMLNLTNFFRHYSPDRFYNLVLYLGPGYGSTFSSKNRPDGASGSSSFLGGAGLLNTFRLSNHVALFANVGLNVQKANFDGYGNTKASILGKGNVGEYAGFLSSENKLDGIASGSIGLIYNFGHAKKKEIVAPPVVVQQEQPKQYSLAVSSNNTGCGTVSGGGTFNAGTRVTAAATPKSGCRFVNWTENGTPVSTSPNYSFALNSNRKLVANYESIPAPPPVVEPVKKAALDPVFFRLDKSIIDPEQEINVQKAADFLKANPNAKLNVVGYADVETANPKYNMALSERRTKAVANELVKKYGINAKRLKLDWKGDTVQPFAINEKNRVVLFSE